MSTIYNRRDFGFTVISRFEETYRNFLIDRLTTNFSDFRIGIPQVIVSKADEKSAIFYWAEVSQFFENLDFPDLLEISIYKDNFEDFFSKPITKSDLSKLMISLYGLRCKIAHVKGYFTSFDLDKLVELSKEVSVYIDTSYTFRSLLETIQKTPELVAIKVPLDFNVDFLESNGIVNNLPTPDYEYEGGFVGREEDIKEITKYLQR